MDNRESVVVAVRSAHQVAGGVERVSIWLANSLAQKSKYKIIFFSWDSGEAKSFYPLSPEVIWETLDCGDHRHEANLLTRLVRLIRIRQLIKRYKIKKVIAFQQGVMFAWFCYSILTPVSIVGCLRNSLRIFEYTNVAYNGFFQKLSFFLANKIVVQFSDYTRQFPAFMRKKIVTIPNPVSISHEKKFHSIPARADAVCDPMNLLAVGRLSFQKDYPTLIKAVGILVGRGVNVSLKIVGDGERHLEIVELIAELHLEANVQLLGKIQNPFESAGDVDLFCHAALWEGFPNAVAEALGHGYPVIGFARCDGLNHLIDSGYNGKLVESRSPRVLADEIAYLFANPDELRLLATNARASVMQFRPEDILRQWIDLIDG